MVWDTIKRGFGDGISYLGSGLRKGLGIEDDSEKIPAHLQGTDPTGNLRGQAQRAGAFADQSQMGYQGLGQQGQAALDHLGGVMRGENSVSAEQLRQGLQQQYGMQASMANSARPGQGGMAARTAAMQMGRAASGMAGNQAMAGIAERNAAAGQYGSLVQGLRGQDLQATLGSRGQALGGLSDYERLRAEERAQHLGMETAGEKFRSAVMGGLAAYGGMG